MDRGYDNNRVYDECHAREVAPVIPAQEGPDSTADAD